MRLPEQLTGEAIEEIANCRKVFTILGHDDLGWLTELTAAPVESVYEDYDHARPRTRNYEEAAAKIAQAAHTKAPVVYLTRGAPWHSTRCRPFS
ncbi:SAM-dependent methyltransferase [Actinomadura alba]|uniref:SAM-dependent methyltransferase n=1 Tax=Actinomadura alba TaxID=406431 RepID=UPI0028AC9880|nr:SAM-dependent methyltransferase [Actinomadura alba]